MSRLRREVAALRRSRLITERPRLELWFVWRQGVRTSRSSGLIGRFDTHLDLLGAGE
jgi:hypothetical protein